MYNWKDNSNENISLQAIRFCGAVAFGSRALGVSEEHSDYDFAILRSTYENLFKDEHLEEYPIKRYFKVIPPYGNNTIITKYCCKDGELVDLLVLEHNEHIQAIFNAVKRLKTLNLRYLYNKQYRIKLFEEALQVEGFKIRWAVVVAEWLLKHF